MILTIQNKHTFLPEDPKDASAIIELLLEGVQTPELYQYWASLPDAKKALYKGVERGDPTVVMCGNIEVTLSHG